jgi:hypothetical protein
VSICVYLWFKRIVPVVEKPRGEIQ